MRTRTRTKMRMTIGAVALAVCLLAKASQAASVTEWPLPFDGSQPYQVAAGSSGVFYVDFDGNTGTTLLGTLDVTLGSFKEIDVPFSAGTGNDLQVRASDGAVFTCDITTSVIVLVDVEQRTLTSWTVPATEAGGPRSIAFDDSGRVLFLESGAIGPTVVGRLDTTSGLVETWQAPDELVTAGSDTAWHLVKAADGSIVFNANGFAHPGQLVRLDPATGLFTAWATPAAPVFGLAADGAGAVYVQEFASGVRNVARLVPATNVLTEWSFSPDAEFTQNMILESASLFFGTDSPVALNQLDPTAAGSDSTLSPAAAAPVSPASVVVSPVVTRRIAKRHGHARGRTSTPSATTLGPFTSWGTATPGFVTGDGAGAVYFTGNGSKGPSISKFVP